MRSTGPSVDTRLKVLQRAGYRCELCLGPVDQGSIHHRQPRQMGGTRNGWVNHAENLLAICGSGTTGCHGHVESQRDESYRTGRLVRAGSMPWEVPFMDMRGNWWFLHEDTKWPLTLPFNIPGSPQ